MKQQRTFSRPGRDDIATSLVLDHNTLLARTRLTAAVHGGPDRAYKAVVHLDSLTVRLQALLLRNTEACISRTWIPAST